MDLLHLIWSAVTEQFAGYKQMQQQKGPLTYAASLGEELPEGGTHFVFERITSLEIEEMSRFERPTG